MSAADDDRRAVTAVIDDLYDAVVAGDRARFDRHLAPDVTIWESHVAGMMRGIDELTRYRDERDAGNGPPSLVSLQTETKLVEVFDGAALIRYRLVARSRDEAPAEFRVTDVLRDDGEQGWRIVHHHAERQAQAVAREQSDG